MLTIAYLGPENTNTHIAARKKFGAKSRYLHAPTVEDVFDLVEREKADFGVIPIENSLEGAVTRTLDRFIDFKRSPARIWGEIEIPIRHNLIMLKTTHEGKISIVYSHPQALDQCRRWLDKRVPTAARRETRSTAEAVEELLKPEFLFKAEERAAIGSAELAKGKLKAIPIPFERDNRTRFLIISLNRPNVGRRNKTSIMFSLKDKPGALHDALMPLKRNRINMTKIESRPSKQRAWEYLFFVDLEGADSEPRVKKALKALERSTSGLRVLGSYPIEGRQGRG